VHRNIGEALEKQNQRRPGRHLGEMAWHFSLAGPSESDRAVLYATRAAEQAEERLAFDEAVDFYAGAIAACRADEPLDQGQLARLLLSQAEAKWKNGMLQEACNTFFEAAEAARQSGLPELMARGALGTLWGGWDAFNTDIAEQLTLFTEALEALGEGESVLKAQVMAGLSQLLFYGAGKATEAHRLAEVALKMVGGFDDPRGELTVLGDTAFIRWEPYFRAERLPTAERLVSLAEEVGESELLAQALAHLVYAQTVPKAVGARKVNVFEDTARRALGGRQGLPDAQGMVAQGHQLAWLDLADGNAAQGAQSP